MSKIVWKVGIPRTSSIPSSEIVALPALKALTLALKVRRSPTWNGILAGGEGGAAGRATASDVPPSTSRGSRARVRESSMCMEHLIRKDGEQADATGGRPSLLTLSLHMTCRADCRGHSPDQLVGFVADFRLETHEALV